jgi:hypothetical protein
MTGIPDEANGILEITGLAQQYLNVSELTRRFRWTGPPLEDGVHTMGAPWRERQPTDNRRLRNRP